VPHVPALRWNGLAGDLASSMKPLPPDAHPWLGGTCHLWQSRVAPPRALRKFEYAAYPHFCLSFDQATNYCLFRRMAELDRNALPPASQPVIAYQICVAEIPRTLFFRHFDRQPRRPWQEPQRLGMLTLFRLSPFSRFVIFF